MILCYRCSKQGHIARDCRSNLFSKSQSEKGKDQKNKHDSKNETNDEN